ncbi:cytochrome-c peroxidase [Lishizhenia sp.]|uniref:cytochrome-c peroxidase n=1 Tax=Lishizhenia sp. TaxID=2497594 RepID=UPI00299E0948|nr:cytochrome c peroxidase [Lishizhenia sp.]MDX1446596.1 cytochrome c peroxidase [Lishizhenia sp.]
MTTQQTILSIAIVLLLFSCKKEDTLTPYTPPSEQEIIDEALNIDLNALENYANQSAPTYITKDNTPAYNPITDAGATLGRVLFYDKALSVDQSTSCASCHKQAHGFGDDVTLSQGVNGLTGRHSMRLINARFGDEEKFFWDERADDLELQSTMPIQDHIEMGFSGENGDLGMSDLIQRLEALPYYPILFNKAFGSETLTEEKMQWALAQFIRSIQSFDAKYDVGRAQVNSNMADFPNFTANENNGKALFMQPVQFNQSGERIGGGAGCAVCHKAPEFDIVPNSKHNGVVGTANNTGTDLTVTRSPSLRNLTQTDGTLNGPFMHTGKFLNLFSVINHYNDISGSLSLQGIDQRLLPNGNPQKLQLTLAEKADIISFLQTLAGEDVYTNEKWSNPFK